MNKPMYPFVWRALFDNDNFASKIYTRTAFESFINFAIVVKFAFKYMFY